MDLRAKHLLKPLAILHERGPVVRASSHEYCQSSGEKVECLHDFNRISNEISEVTKEMKEEPKPDKPKRSIARPMPKSMISFSLEVPGQGWLTGPSAYLESNEFKHSCTKIVEAEIKTSFAWAF